MRAVEAPPPPEALDQVMPETAYTRAIDWLVTHTTDALHSAHTHVAAHVSRMDQHVISCIACWQAQHPWLFHVSLQRRSALRFRLAWRRNNEVDVMCKEVDVMCKEVDVMCKEVDVMCKEVDVMCKEVDVMCKEVDVMCKEAGVIHG